MPDAAARRALIARFLAALAAVLALAACHTSQDVPPERLPRFEPLAGPPPKVALVLGSGGPRGFAHIGVLKVLEEEGVRPDIVIGSSVGALVGVLHAGGTSAVELERLARELNILEFFFELRMLRGDPSSGAAVQGYVNERLGHRRIEELPMPFVATATRLADGAIVLFNRGDAGLAVRASGASPGSFEPVRIGQALYVDGDESSPVPIRVARQLGAKLVIAVDVSAYPETTPEGVPREWIEKDERRLRRIADEAPGADVMLHPDIGYYAGHDARYRERVIAIAEKYTRERMPAVREAFAKAGIPLRPQNRSTARTPAGVTSR